MAGCSGSRRSGTRVGAKWMADYSARAMDSDGPWIPLGPMPSAYRDTAELAVQSALHWLATRSPRAVERRSVLLAELSATGDGNYDSLNRRLCGSTLASAGRERALGAGGRQDSASADPVADGVPGLPGDPEDDKGDAESDERVSDL